MPRPDTSSQRRREFAPLLTRAFAELGYRRATTAVLAERCGVQENILYRLWSDKRAMFIASLDHVYQASEAAWAALLVQEGSAASPAERILEYESTHHGEHGLYRIVFAGLSETDDPEIAAALKRLYGRFQRFVQRQVERHRGGPGAATGPDAALAAWAIVGLGTVSNIGRELGLLSAARRRRLVLEAGAMLLGQRA
ncbi:MAG: TetR/AcrR family transcriptional regulator [Planctomycetes bacterium]|nr:TetR/AcrR family transcriptional regulator [Planctomycetota bacterium]